MVERSVYIIKGSFETRFRVKGEDAGGNVREGRDAGGGNGRQGTFVRGSMREGTFARERSEGR